MTEQATLSNSSDEEVTIPRRSKDRKRPSRISSDDDQELEHARPPVDNVDNGLDQKNQSSPLEEAVTRCSKDSARKRTVMIPSEDDDGEDLEDAGAENATPSVALGQHDERRKRSCEKFRRQLMLDEYKAQREESRAKKKRRLSGHESDMNDQRHSSRHESMDEKVFPSTQSGAEDEPESEAQSPIPISSDSEEDSSTPNSKDGSSQDESPIPIPSDSEEDLSTPNSEDASSQDEEEDPTLGGFIVPNSESRSEDVDWKENGCISAEDLHLLWKPTEEEVFEIFLQSLLTKLLLDEDPSFGCFEPIMKKSPYHVAAKRKVESVLESKKNLLSSSRWDRKFMDELKKNSGLTHKKLPHAFEGKCQACRFSRGITRKISLQNDNGEKVAEFRVGRFCAGKATIYQKIHHFCDVKLKKTCKRKIPGLKEIAAADRDRPVIESVIEYCKREEQRQWMNQLFDDYQKLLNRADKWAKEGRHYKDMQSTVFSDRT